jgi:hypothetical protein
MARLLVLKLIVFILVLPSGGFRGISVVSIETPFVPAYSVIDVQLF